MKYKHIEFLIPTILLLTSVYLQLEETNLYLSGSFSSASFKVKEFGESRLNYNFFLNNLLPVLIRNIVYYLSFLWIVRTGLDENILKGSWGKALIIIGIGFLSSWSVLSLQAYLKEPFGDSNKLMAISSQLGKTLELYGMIITYLGLKLLLLKSSSSKIKGVRPASKLFFIEFGILSVLWLTIITLCTLLNLYREIGQFFGFVVPAACIIYLLNVYELMPRYYNENRLTHFWLMLAASTIIVSIPFTGLFSAVVNTRFLTLFIFIWLFQICVITPLSYYVYESRRRKASEILSLQTDLTNSNASLVFLRSQINPHFLFNALNTLYGMSLTEKADKTSHGIQILGDMMRFMLHENNQEQIALAKDIDYLNNYLELQRLRIHDSRELSFDIQIERPEVNFTIAPMLLIPFVENAFKHGLDGKKPSWIRISLSVKEHRLHFEISNTVHKKRENKHDGDVSGIGLDNVKQRLKIIYPDHHHLLIKEDTESFFVHLEIKLKMKNSNQND